DLRAGAADGACPGEHVVDVRRLDEADGGEAAAAEVAEGVGLVLQVRHCLRGTGQVAGEVGERDVLQGEERVGVAGQEAIPALRVVGPGDAAVGEPVPDGGRRLLGELAQGEDV